MSDRYFDIKEEIAVKVRKLPHWTQKGKMYFVTFRLSDSLPQSLIIALKEEREEWVKKNGTPWTLQQKKEYHRLFNQRIENWIDAGYGSCILRKPEVSKISEDSICYFEDVHYTLHCYVIMANHVHLMIEPFANKELKDILHSIKSYSANQINKSRNRHGRLWSIESYDRIIRDAAHYENIRSYIAKNIREGGIRWRM